MLVEKVGGTRVVCFLVGSKMRSSEELARWIIKPMPSIYR